jgi:ATP-dependent helicase HrpB
MQPLPIDGHLADVVQALAHERCLVVQAPPGTGKSTRIPIALHRALFTKDSVLVAEPRRIAARLLADRVASEINERTGQTVGYRVRFEQVCTAQTRVCYATSGVLLRQLVSDPKLGGVACLVIDEFHERHLDTDLLLALALHAQRASHPELKILVMSATLDTERVSALLGVCPIVRAEEVRHPVQIDFSATDDERPLEKQVASALRQLQDTGPPGDALVFLPGAREIRAVAEHLAGAAPFNEVDVLSLHGDMPLAKQAEVLQPRARTRIILTTNVAESSLTVPGVVNVVDSGLARRAACSPWTGFASLEVHKISRASATQRSGRAGRLSRGRTIRLFTQREFNTRPEYETPEILRLDLCEAVLLLRAAASCSLDELGFVDHPSSQQLAAAEQLLMRLGALDERGKLSTIGRRMVHLPLHPRLARMVLETERAGMPELGCLAAAVLSEKDLRLDFRVRLAGGASAAKPTLGDSDVLELIDAFEWAEDCGFNRSRCAQERIDAVAARRVADVQRQLLKGFASPNTRPEPALGVQVALGKALLRGFPDRVAWCRQPGQSELVLTNGGTARLSETSVVQNAQYLLAIDADEKSYHGRKSAAWVRIACRIDPNWLLDLDTPLLQTEERHYWAEGTGRVQIQSTLRYGSIILDESHAMAVPGAEAAAVLVHIATERGVLQGESIGRLREKLRLLVSKGLLPNELLPTDAFLQDALQRLCAERVDLAGLDDVALADAIAASLGCEAAQALARWSPDWCQLIAGRRVKIHYEPSCSPWIASRLQDFFGMDATPLIADGRQPLTLHLLAPNQRAVQVTQDLAGFWDRHYGAVRRELMRRYPKHKWPENPRSSQPAPSSIPRARRS